MFNDIGVKIKNLAKVICWLEIIVAVIGGISFMVIDEDFILTGLAVMIIGAVTAWLSSFLLYGFGELIDRVCDIADVVNPQSRTSSNNAGVSKLNENEHSNVVSYDGFGFCGICDKDTKLVASAKITNDMGTFYRNICQDCYDKYIENIQFQNAQAGRCDLCNNESGEISTVKFSDDKGVHYHNICRECYKKNKDVIK